MTGCGVIFRRDVGMCPGGSDWGFECRMGCKDGERWPTIGAGRIRLSEPGGGQARGRVSPKVSGVSRSSGLSWWE